MPQLMMEQGYKPAGWLGLMLGTRLWHPFYEEAVATDEAFTQQMDSLAREIGDRGKLVAKPKPAVAEGVPPVIAPVIAPTPALAASTLGPAPAPARATSLAPVSPSMLIPTPMQQQVVSSGGLTEMASFLKEQQMLMIKHAEKAKQDVKSERAEMLAEMQKQLEKQREELTPQEAVSTDQLVALEARLEKLHASKLLSDDELYAMEVSTHTCVVPNTMFLRDEGLCDCS